MHTSKNIISGFKSDDLCCWQNLSPCLPLRETIPLSIGRYFIKKRGEMNLEAMQGIMLLMAVLKWQPIKVCKLLNYSNWYFEAEWMVYPKRMFTIWKFEYWEGKNLVHITSWHENRKKKIALLKFLAQDTQGGSLL